MDTTQNHFCLTLSSQLQTLWSTHDKLKLNWFFLDVSSMSCKSSPRDFVSTTLVKYYSSVFSVIITRLANLSFIEGVFPSSFKTVQIPPRLKKAGLDPLAPSSYRPISNLNTISKILERLYLARLVPHVSPSICPYSPRIANITRLKQQCWK